MDLQLINKRIDDINDMCAEIRYELTEINKILSKNVAILERNTIDMAEHIKRTNLLEKQVEETAYRMKFAKWLITIGFGTLGTILGAYRLLINFFSSH